MSSRDPTMDARRSGHCGEVQRNAPQDCVNGNQGSWPLFGPQARDPVLAVAACLTRCSQCKQCSFVAYSLKLDDCSWYRECAAAALVPLKDFVTVKVNKTASWSWAQPLPSPWLAEGGSSRTAPFKVYIYDFEQAWSSRNRIGVPLGRQPFGPALDAYGTTAASAATYTSAVLALSAAWRTNRPEEADLFFLPSPSGLTPSPVDGRWCTSPLEMFSKHWSGSVDYLARHGCAHPALTSSPARPARNPS